MNKLLLFLSIFLFFLWINWVNSNENENENININKVFKIEAYSLEELNNSYILEQYWSSVYIKDWIIYTNAHVVLDNDNNPIWNYRVCKTIDFKEKPQCFSTWELLYYDIKNDIAALRISDPWVDFVEKSKKKLEIWDTVKVYGYPSNWWNTITYTEWKISWYEEWFYKIDANIDAWNSWGWVFDLDWNLIWLSVAVKIWYSTMWYIIPLSKIEDFDNKNDIHNIENYNIWTEESFNKYHLLLKDKIWINDFSNSEVEINELSTYGFMIDDYQVDNNNKFFSINLFDKNNETYIKIYNSNLSWKKDIVMDDIYNDLIKEWEELKEDFELSNYIVKKIKLKKRNTVLFLWKFEDWSIFLGLLIEVSKNNYQNILISTDNIKNKSFINWVKLILKNIKLNEVNYSINNSNMKLDNLEILKTNWFFVSKDIDWDILEYHWDDINILESITVKENIKFFEDYTLESLWKKLYNWYKNIINYDYFWIKKTSFWDYYIYNFFENEIESWKIYESWKKYLIKVEFFDKKNSDIVYDNILIFNFDNIESKYIIDDFIKNIKTSSNELPFELWNIIVWENLVEELQNNIE